MKRMLLAAVLLLGPGDAVWAGFDEGLAAAKRGDYMTAAKEWLPLAEQGHVGAQYNIGVLYDRGLGVPQDFAEAIEWYRRAAERGHLDAQANLGFAYQQGRGVAQDYAAAAKWYRMAAARGDVAAQTNLGWLYANGLGVEQDDVQAHMWLNLAAARAPRGKLRRRALKNRDIVARRMAADAIAEAQRLAREWRPAGP
ncbi:MAG: tetratricopeptide repeat protein [Kiloniellaceae bacterium]